MTIQGSMEWRTVPRAQSERQGPTSAYRCGFWKHVGSLGVWFSICREGGLGISQLDRGLLLWLLIAYGLHVNWIWNCHGKQLNLINLPSDFTHVCLPAWENLPPFHAPNSALQPRCWTPGFFWCGRQGAGQSQWPVSSNVGFCCPSIDSPTGKSGPCDIYSLTTVLYCLQDIFKVSSKMNAKPLKHSRLKVITCVECNCLPLYGPFSFQERLSYAAFGAATFYLYFRFW